MSEKIKRWMSSVDTRLRKLERSRSRPSKGGGGAIPDPLSVNTLTVNSELNLPSGAGLKVAGHAEIGALDVGPGGIYDDGVRVLNHSDIEMLNIGTQNLNTFTTPGYRFQNSTANATSDRNYPPGGLEAGALEVLPNVAGNFLNQRYTTYSTRRVFIRNLYMNNWSAWKEIATYDGLPAASETARGTVERATQAEVNAGTDTTRYVSPATLAGRVSPVQQVSRANVDSVTAETAAEFNLTIVNPMSITVPTPRWYRFVLQGWKGGGLATELRVGIELSGATTSNYNEPQWGAVAREVGEGSITAEKIVLLNAGTTTVKVKGYKIGTNHPTFAYQILTAYPV